MPRMSLRSMDSELKRRMSPSLALLTIASLTPKEHTVHISDENISNIDFVDNPDLVGINVNIDTSKRAFEIANIYRNKGIKVVFGGIHASANAKEMLKYCDSVLIGEAEMLWSILLSDFINNCLQPIYFNELTPDLSSIPILSWKHIKQKSYLYNNIVITSKGCPFKCDFCYNSCEYITMPYRNRPIEHIIAEIKNIGSKQIMFIDDNFIGNPIFSTNLALELKKLNIIWHAAVSANIINHKEIINTFAESGCKSLFIGFESINKHNINSVSKNQNKIEKYEELIDLLHKKGIMVNASVVFGFDFDEKTVFKETLNWLVKNKIESMTAHILTPYPGTKLYTEMVQENRITDWDTNHYNTSNVVFQPKKMTALELKEGYLWIYNEFYAIRNIVKRIPAFRKNRLPFLLFNFGYRKYGRLTAIIGKLGLMNYIGRLARKLAYGID